MSNKVNKTAHPFDKQRFDSVLNRRFFYAPAFEIYGGVAGLYDYGPPGSALQSNILTEWRKHFILHDSMHELDTTIITPSPVFETSGHVARFADWMCKDVKTGDVLRADHLVKAVLGERLALDREARGEAGGEVGGGEDDKKKKKRKGGEKKERVPVRLDDEVVREYAFILAKLDDYTGPQLADLITTHSITNPDTSNPVSPPIQFNLMFTTTIGPTGTHAAYLRPETAQGHFLNFPRLLDFNNGKLPFGSAQIGRSFRNEISPRAGLLRVREFTMAEVEWFVDPEDKKHARFSEISHIELPLLDRATQERGEDTLRTMSMGQAVKEGIIANETLAYFLARIHTFLIHIGITPTLLRFRQHMSNEMAHYACDCWDAEIFNVLGGGWTECVGCADRSAYDLSVHRERTGAGLCVREALREPRVEERWVGEWDKKEVGKRWKGEGKEVVKVVEGYSEEQLMEVKGKIEGGGSYEVTIPSGKTFEVTKELLTIEKKTFKTSVREYIPNVIEPSFGIGRILYALLEHSFWARESDVDRGVLSLPPAVAPTKVLIVPLSAKEEFVGLVREVSTKMRDAGILSSVDDSSATIGKRYARNDELGTPFGVTLDFASLQNKTMTLRERDTTEQLIGPIDEIVTLVGRLCRSEVRWDDVVAAIDEGKGEAKVLEGLGGVKRYDGVQAV